MDFWANLLSQILFFRGRGWMRGVGWGGDQKNIRKGPHNYTRQSLRISAHENELYWRHIRFTKWGGGRLEPLGGLFEMLDWKSVRFQRIGTILIPGESPPHSPGPGMGPRPPRAQIGSKMDAVRTPIGCRVGVSALGAVKNRITRMSKDG